MLIAIVLGIIVGSMFPEFGASMKILAGIFIKLIKMLISPITFLTVVIGIGNMGDVKKVGKIGYFTSNLCLHSHWQLAYLLSIS